MNSRLILTCVALFFFVSNAISQKDDPVLFTVENDPVHVSEFKYIYAKTNGDKATFSKQSLEEYLDLYVKFKLKVQKAKEMKLDTIPALQKELAGYRRQLANSYLIDKQVTEKLTHQAFDRSQQDVNITHIMLKMNPGASPQDTLEAYRKLVDIRKRIVGGEEFGALAKEFSDDKSVTENGGNIGYLTALFPKGFYDLETAAYSLPIGELSQPLRSSVGYHLIKVNQRRPARGEMEAAHILIRNKKKGRTDAQGKALVDSLYNALADGSNFENLAKTFSEDNMSAKKGGYIGKFGISKYELDFEDACFAIEKDGDISRPFETSVGWHIAKRVTKRDNTDYEKSKRGLQTKIQKDSRYEMAKTAMIESIKNENNFNEKGKNIVGFSNSLDSEFMTHKWRAADVTSNDVFFTLGKNKYTAKDFAAYAQKASRERMRMGKNAKVDDVVQKLYAGFVAESCMKFEEEQLEKKYPEFKSLMREYEEGILLFEATKMQVWDKASQDTTGLKKFHQTRKAKYRYAERAVVNQYSLKATASDQLNKLKKYVAKNGAKSTLEKFNGDDGKIVSVQEKTIEKGKNKVLDKMKWKVGEFSPTEIDKRNKSSNFFKVEKLLPAEEKTLKQARGYVVADYQDFLERQWIEQLREKYNVDIDNKVLESLIK